MGRPRLSVCCLTGDDGARVAAILGMLRPVADEIVVAADSRADDDRLAAYASVADRLLRVEFDYLERHLAWLHAQCSGAPAAPRLGPRAPGAGGRTGHRGVLPARGSTP